MTFIKKLLKPDAVYSKMSDVPFSSLYDMGFKYAFLDLDNTLAADHVCVPVPYTYEIIANLQKTGFTCCIVSNAKSSRSADFAAMIPIACISYANKPSISGINRALDLLSAKREETVFFGDQIFTDILAANRAKIYSVLVDPLTSEEVFYVRMKRPLEKFIRYLYHF